MSEEAPNHPIQPEIAPPALPPRSSSDQVAGDKISLTEVHESTLAVGERAAAADHGIAISGNISGNLVISMGNTLVAIPRQVMTLLLLILAGIVALSGFQIFNAYQTIQPPAPTTAAPMTGDFNIAIAQFQIIAPTPNDSPHNEIQDIMLGFANTIHRETVGLSSAISDTIQTRFPQETGVIAGATEVERAANAYLLAEAIHAHVVIYGALEITGSSAVIRPEFYVSGSDFTLAAEMTGQYRLGQPIRLEKIDNRRFRNEVEAILEERTQALIWMLEGLADFSAGYYDKAEERFIQALNVQSRDNPDVIYVWLGNTALQQQAFKRSQDYFSQALAANPNYARAYNGLAAALWFQATAQAADPSQFDMPLITQSLTLYQQALNCTEKPPLADSAAKATLGIAEVYYARGLHALFMKDLPNATSQFALAIENYQIVIEEYKTGNTRLQEAAGRAYAKLGTIGEILQRPAYAIANYEHAIELLPPYGSGESLKEICQNRLEALGSPGKP